MIGEVIVHTDEDSFDSFYKKNKKKILKTLNGKKMKLRTLKNAKKVLDESTDLHSRAKENILLDALNDTVTEAVLEGFEGEEFDNFKFAKKLKEKVQKFVNKPLSPAGKKIDLPDPKIRIPIFNKKAKAKRKAKRAAKHGQLASPVAPTPDSTVNAEPASVPASSSPPAVTPAPSEIQEKNFAAVQSNGSLAFPNQGISGGMSFPQDQQNMDQPESIAEDTEIPSGSTQQNAAPAVEAGSSQETSTDQKQTPATDKEKAKKKKTTWIVIGAVILLLVILAFFWKGKGAVPATNYSV